MPAPCLLLSRQFERPSSSPDGASRSTRSRWHPAVVPVDEQTAHPAEVPPRLQQLAVLVEDLDSVIPAIGDVLVREASVVAMCAGMLTPSGCDMIGADTPHGQETRISRPGSPAEHTSPRTPLMSHLFSARRSAACDQPHVARRVVPVRLVQERLLARGQGRSQEQALASGQRSSRSRA
jgi:hypothetical protein